MVKVSWKFWLKNILILKDILKTTKADFITDDSLLQTDK